MHGKAVGALRSGGRRAVGGRRDPVLLGPVMPSTTGSTASRWEGFDAMVIGSSSPALPWKTPCAPLWYFTSPEPWTDSGSRLPSNSSKISRYDLPDDVGQHVEAAAVGHAHHDLGDAGAGGRVEQGVEQDDGRLGAFEAEALLPDVARVEEALEHLGGVEAVEDVALLLEVERGRLALDVLLDPALLLGVLDVHVLDAEGPAVGVAQDVEDLVERGDVATGQPVGDELARQVPDGEAVRAAGRARGGCAVARRRAGRGGR